MKKGEERIFWVDSLRFIAIVLIVLFHVLYEKSLDNRLRFWGFLGISLFFIISGFSLAKKYPKYSRFDFSWFFKRFTKLAIPYYLALIAIVFLFGHQVYSGKFGEIFLHFIFLNFAVSDATYSIISPAWFIIPLIACYALFPYFNREIKRSNYFLVIIFAISVVYRVMYSTLSSVSPLFFFAEFCFGIAFAQGQKKSALFVSMLILIATPFMFLPFLLFYFFSFIDKKVPHSVQIALAFFAGHTLEIMLYHEAFIKLFFGKWEVWGNRGFMAAVLFLGAMTLAIFLSKIVNKKINGRYIINFVKKRKPSAD